MPVDTTPDRSMNEMERTPFVTETLRVRCPNCRKLYLVQFSDIKEAKPRFECVQCHSRFWLSLPDMDLNNELNGIPLQVKEAPKTKAEVAQNLEPCPKCFKPVAVGSHECNHCGVVIEKLKGNFAFTDSTLTHSTALQNSWQKLIADYGNEQLHEDFIRMADRERALPYAGSQYGQMLKLMPSDETTKRRVAEIQALGMAALPPREARMVPRLYPRLWQIPLFGAALLMLAGMWIPFFRNLVGVGAAFLFLGIALQMQLRRK